MDHPETGRYPYRDDGLLVYKALYDYVKKYVELYYSDTAVPADRKIKPNDDHYLSQFVDEMNTFFPRNPNTPPVVEPIKTVDDLIQRITDIIWTCSAQHAAVNFGQYTQANYMPQRPSALMRSPMDIKTVQNEHDFFTFMPTRAMAVMSSQTHQQLSLYSEKEQYLLENPTPGRTDTVWPPMEKAPGFGKAEAEQARKEFIDKLRTIETTILQANSGSGYGRPYLWLLPSKIPNSIAI